MRLQKVICAPTGVIIWMEWSGEWYMVLWTSLLYMVNSVELMVAHTAGVFWLLVEFHKVDVGLSVSSVALRFLAGSL